MRLAFLGGTYFPPADQLGRPGFLTLLHTISHQWKANRRAIEDSTDRLLHGLKLLEMADPSCTNGQDLEINLADLNPAKTVAKLMAYFSHAFDPVNGGFGQAPKFPTVTNLQFIWCWYLLNSQDCKQSEQLKNYLMSQLMAMAKGGIRDHVCGGFHRYSVDAKWHVPHFEKMLYDQAQLMSIYSKAYILWKEPSFKQIVNEIFNYTTTHLLSPKNGFYCAEDADSLPTFTSGEKKEGAFAVWTFDQITKILKEAGNDPTAFIKHYGVTPLGNIPSNADPHQELLNQNVLYETQSEKDTIKEFGIESFKLLAKQKELLADFRVKNRPSPHLDDKILTSWNGLLISGLVEAYKANLLETSSFEGRKFLDQAYAIVQFIKDDLLDANGQLFRSWRDGERSAIKAFPDDYTFFIQGLLDLHQIDLKDKEILDLCVSLQSQLDADYWDSTGTGGYFSSRLDDPNVILKLKDDYDGAEPSPNAIAAINLLRLYHLTDNSEYWERFNKLLNGFRSKLMEQPQGMTSMMVAWLLANRGPLIVTIDGLDPTTKGSQSLLLRRLHLLDNPLVIIKRGKDSKQTDRLVAHVCHNNTCLEPSEDPAVILQQISTIISRPL